MNDKLAKREKANLTKSLGLFERVREILDAARARVARSVNTEMVEAYWRFGEAIVEQGQKGEQSAGYGESLIEDLSKRPKISRPKVEQSRRERLITQNQAMKILTHLWASVLFCSFR